MGRLSEVRACYPSKDKDPSPFSPFTLGKSLAFPFLLLCTYSYSYPTPFLPSLTFFYFTLDFFSFFLPFLYTCINSRVSQKTAFSREKFHDRGQKKAWVTYMVRKYIYIFFLILSIPWSSNCKKKPFRGFSEILLHPIYYEFTSFSIFWLNKKIREKNKKSIFSGILYISYGQKKVWVP